MGVIAIVGNGPDGYLPELKQYSEAVDIWIGADRGALAIIQEELPLHYAVGDFDSVTREQKKVIFEHAHYTNSYEEAKDATDLEIALNKAFDLSARKVYLFGITGGRLDHAMANIQLLYSIINRNVRGIIINRQNQMELLKAGTHEVSRNELYRYVSFVPFTETVTKISLEGFKYPLTNMDVSWGSTRLISNEFAEEEGKVSFSSGLLMFIQSRDDLGKK